MREQTAAARRHDARAAYRRAIDELAAADRAAVAALRARQTARQTVRRLARAL